MTETASNTDLVLLLDLLPRTGLSVGQLDTFIRRGDLHIVQLGGRTYQRYVLATEADAFCAFIEQVRATAPPPDRLRGYYCRDMGRCFCRCHAYRQGDRKRKLKSTKIGGWDRWLPDHDRFILKLAKQGYPTGEIQTRFNAAHQVNRSFLAIRRRITKLGGSTNFGWLSLTELGFRLGCGAYRLERWVKQGVITPFHTGHTRRFSEATVEQFVKEQAGLLFSPSTVTDARLRSLAEMAAHVNQRQQRMA